MNKKKAKALLPPFSVKPSRALQRIFDRFPEIVAEKKRAYKKRQLFLKKTFGALMKQVEKEFFK